MEKTFWGKASLAAEVSPFVLKPGTPLPPMDKNYCFGREKSSEILIMLIRNIDKLR